MSDNAGNGGFTVAGGRKSPVLSNDHVSVALSGSQSTLVDRPINTSVRIQRKKVPAVLKKTRIDVNQRTTEVNKEFSKDKALCAENRTAESSLHEILRSGAQLTSASSGHAEEAGDSASPRKQEESIIATAPRNDDTYASYGILQGILVTTVPRPSSDSVDGPDRERGVSEKVFDEIFFFSTVEYRRGLFL